ncbi:hypothetical protein BJX70DRAFT_361330 [Aspergillus crustosus]
MASGTYETLCHEIYEDLRRVLQRPDEENLRFMPRGAAEKVLHQDKLLRFFKSLVAPGTTALQQFGVVERDLVARVNERHLHDFLAVLIFASCPSWTTVFSSCLSLMVPHFGADSIGFLSCHHTSSSSNGLVGHS